MKKYILFALFIIICMSSITAYGFECNTTPEDAEKTFQALVENRMSKNINKKVISSYSLFPDLSNLHYFMPLMPSTGNSRVLILPIEFADVKFSEYGDLDDIYNEFFAEYNPDETLYKQHSVRAHYQMKSYGKLNISGGILPLYTASGNQADYSESSDMSNLIREALQSYEDFNFADYDSNKDGYVDVVCVKIACKLQQPPPFKLGYSTSLNATLCDGTQTGEITVTHGFGPSISPDMTAMDEHELGHSMGLPDNYDNHGFNCDIDGQLLEVMSGCRGYFNVYYKYLLEWISEEDGTLKILTNEDIINNESENRIELSAVERFQDEYKNKTKAVIFSPHRELLPFTEYYIAEYRAGGIPYGELHYYDKYIFKNNSGVVVWHCNTAYALTINYKNPNNFLKPVYKSGNKIGNVGEEYLLEDLYKTGDEFSSETAASSDFYNNIHTGAYMKVLSEDENSAVINAGFIEPNLSTPPNITISKPSNPMVKSYYPNTSDYGSVTYEITYDNYTSINFDKNDISVIAPDGVRSSFDLAVEGNKATIEIRFSSRDRIEGEGYFEIRPGTAMNEVNPARKAVSEPIIIDNTEPEIALNGESEVYIQKGDKYIDEGVTIKDNFDANPQIEVKGEVNTEKPGTYVIEYSAVDYAGNHTLSEKRTVTVYDPIIRYSTNQPTNKPVDVTLAFYGCNENDIVITNNDGSNKYTFEENGSFDFEYKYKNGKSDKLTVTVDWIDKTSPTSVVEYSTTAPTNESVTAVITFSEDVSFVSGSYSTGIVCEYEYTIGVLFQKVILTFSTNGKYKVNFRDRAGNTSEMVEVVVDWIDKTPPTGSVKYSPSGITTGPVTATLTTSEEIKPIEMTHKFTENGSYTFEYEDLAGNKGSTTAIVDWIVEAIPTPTPTPTAAPSVTPSATATPSAEPTATPTTEPTATPTAEPTATPTASPLPTYPPTSPTPTSEPIYNWQINSYENNIVTLTAPQNAEGAYIIIAKYNGDYLTDCEIMYLSDLPYGKSQIQMSKNIKAQNGETLKIMLWNSSLSPLTDPLIQTSSSNLARKLMPSFSD